MGTKITSMRTPSSLGGQEKVVVSLGLTQQIFTESPEDQALLGYAREQHNKTPAPMGPKF